VADRCLTQADNGDGAAGRSAAYEYARKNGERHASGDPSDPVNGETQSLINQKGWLARQCFCGPDQCENQE